MKFFDSNDPLFQYQFIQQTQALVDAFIDFCAQRGDNSLQDSIEDFDKLNDCLIKNAVPRSVISTHYFQRLTVLSSMEKSPHFASFLQHFLPAMQAREESQLALIYYQDLAFAFNFPSALAPPFAKIN